jgi:O-succinylbenzoate synthase
VIRPTTIELREVRLPLRAPFRISSGVTDIRRLVLVQVTDQDGISGWAECVAGERPNYSPETVDTAWHALVEWIVPLTKDREFSAPPDLAAALDLEIRGHRMARAAVEMALWDVAARRDNMSLATALGGTRPEVATGISLGLQDSPHRLGELAADAVREGYLRIKVKIAPGRDTTDLEAVRTAIGDAVALSADANAAYRPEQADALRALDAFNLVMLEQPLESEDLLRHALLQRTLQTPICLDESITGLERAADMIALRAGRIINIKPGRVGGLTAARAIHDLALEHGVPVWCGGMLETGIGRAHNVALASLPGFSLPGDLSPSARYWERDIVTPAWTMAEGSLTVPRNTPGLGVDVDMGFLDQCTTRRVVYGPDRPTG